MDKKNYNDKFDSNFNELKGLIITKIEGNVGDEVIIFHTSNNVRYRMKYYSDCCATCSLEDIIGDLNNIIGNVILKAEEVFSHDNPSDVIKEDQDSFTWTFYHISTIKGTVTLRWYGESNGYYSESVTFERLDPYPKVNNQLPLP